MRHGVWMGLVLMTEMACGPNPAVGGGCAGAGASEPDCSPDPGELVVQVDRGGGLGFCGGDNAVMSAQVRAGANGGPAVLTGEVLRCPDAGSCATSLHTVPLVPVQLDAAELSGLQALVLRLPKEGCRVTLNPNCDYCLNVNMQANGAWYTQNVCAVQPCWTPEMNAVTEYVYGLVARHL